MDVFKQFCYYVVERNRIYKNKEILHTTPLTNDNIFLNFKFTNVKRWQDRESRWLIKNVCCNDELTYREKVINSLLFRSWNKGKTYEILGGPWKEDFLKDPPVDILDKKICEFSKEHPDYVWFTNAFNTGGIKNSWKDVRSVYNDDRLSREVPEEFLCKDIPLRMFYLAESIIKRGILDKICEGDSVESIYSAVCDIKGYAVFLSYQAYIDLTYIKEFPYDEDSLLVAGPGCRKGAEYLYEYDYEDFDGEEGENIYTRIRSIEDEQKKIFSNYGYDLDEEFSYLPKYYRSLTLMDIENILCEFSKYIRAWSNSGRPKVRYDKYVDNYRPERDADREFLEKWLVDHNSNKRLL